jgi:hypothetical protein
MEIAHPGHPSPSPSHDDQMRQILLTRDPLVLDTHIEGIKNLLVGGYSHDFDLRHCMAILNDLQMQQVDIFIKKVVVLLFVSIFKDIRVHLSDETIHTNPIPKAKRKPFFDRLEVLSDELIGHIISTDTYFTQLWQYYIRCGTMSTGQKS